MSDRAVEAGADREPGPPVAGPRLGWHLVGESGGLRYHLRALVGRAGWAPFHAAVAGWLAGWAPGTDRLVLVGPSAGYALPPGYLARYRQVVALEPDPVARWLLGRRQDAGHLTFAPVDALAGRAGLEALARLARAHGDPWRPPTAGTPATTADEPHAAILFCNVLGQIEAPAGTPWRELLAEALAGLAWASFHDVFSTERAPDRAAPIALQRPPPLEELLARFWTGGELDGTDHDTLGLGGDAPHAFAPWRLARRRHYLVEWHAHRPGAAGAAATPGGRAP